MASYCKKRMLPEPGANLGRRTKKELLPYAAKYDTGMPREFFPMAYEEVGRASELNLEPMRTLARAQYGLQVDDKSPKAQVLEGIVREITRRLQPATLPTEVQELFKKDPPHLNIFLPPQQETGGATDTTFPTNPVADLPARRGTAIFGLPLTRPDDVGLGPLWRPELLAGIGWPG